MNLRTTLLGLPAFIVVAGCGGHLHVTQGTAAGKAATPNSVAVVNFAVEQQSTRNRIADGCLDGIQKAGVHVVEREHVSQVMKDNGITPAAEPTVQDVQKLGKLVSSDAIIIGNAAGHMDLVVNRFMVTSIEARLVDVASGEEIRAVNFSDLESTDDGFIPASQACELLMER
jgi:hypothetical protein